MAKDRRSRDQKRKQKLARKRKSSSNNNSLKYTGNKYQTEATAFLWKDTEVGIYQAYVISDRKLFDDTVVEAITTLIKQLRSRSEPLFAETATIEYQPGCEEQLVIDCIRTSWTAAYFDDLSRPSRNQCIGVLRSLLASIDRWRDHGRSSKGYLRYLTDFVTRQLGVRVEEVGPGPDEEMHSQRIAAG